MSVWINGLGILSACGRGIGALRSALHAGWRPPVFVTLPGNRQFPVYPLPPGALEDRSLGRKVRRADRFSKIGIFAASDALENAQLPGGLDRSRIGLIVSSAFGSHDITFQFLDEILTYGDAGVSPTVFSHSVQNAGASYITSTLDLRGPALTITQVHFAFHHALLLAQGWLENGRCDHVLVGAIDELGSVMQAICGSMLKPALDGKIQPFNFARNPGCVPGEGSAFFLLSNSALPGACGLLRKVAASGQVQSHASPDLHILEADGFLADETAYALPATSGAQLAAYAPLFGSMTGGSALQMAVAALMMKERICFASPVPDSPHALPICRCTTSALLETIHLTRLNCTGRTGAIHLAQV